MDKAAPVTEATSFFKMLLYGQSGAGKTALAASAPGALLIDTEHGARTLLNHPELSDVKVIRITEFKEVESIFGN